MFHQLIGSQEAIAYRKDRSFFEELVGVLDPVMRKIKEDCKDLQTLEYMRKASTIARNSNVKTEIPKVIEKHTGLKIPFLLKKVAPFACGISMSYQIDNTSIHPWDKVPKTRRKKTEAIVDIIKTMRDGVDLTAGDVSAFTRDRFILRIRTDPSWFFPEKVADIAEGIGAEELAAVILHEIGHALTQIEHCAEWIYRSDIVKTEYALLDETFTPEEATELLESCIASLSAYGDRPDAREVSAALKRVLRDRVGSDTSDDMHRMIMMLARQTAYIVYASEDKRTYDLTDTGSPAVPLMERTADEYAVRMGAGPALARGLKMLINLGDQSMPQGPDATGQNALLTTSRIKAFINAFNLNPMMATDVYDPDFERLRQISAAAHRGASDPTLTPEMRECYVDSIRESDRVLKEYGDQTHVGVRRRLFGFYQTLARLGVIRALPVLYAEMSRSRQFYDFTEQLIKSPVHRDLGRLEIAVRKKKIS